MPKSLMISPLLKSFSKTLNRIKYSTMLLALSLITAWKGITEPSSLMGRLVVGKHIRWAEETSGRREESSLEFYLMCFPSFAPELLASNTLWAFPSSKSTMKMAMICWMKSIQKPTWIVGPESSSWRTKIPTSKWKMCKHTLAKPKKKVLTT